VSTKAYRESHREEIRAYERERRRIHGIPAHRAAYYRRYNKWRGVWLNLIRQLTPCADCGKFYPHYMMQFDHHPDKGKVGNVGGLASWRLMLREMAKCDIVCANCHARRTYFRRKGISLDDGPAPPSVGR
jgi:hypothetical protein